MPRFTYPDGRWVRLRPMYVLDELAFDDLASTGDELEAAIARLPEVKEKLQGAETDEQKDAAAADAVEAVTAYQAAYRAQLRVVYERLHDACEETSWGGELGQRITSAELLQLSRLWRAGSEDETLPPV